MAANPVQRRVGKDHVEPPIKDKCPRIGLCKGQIAVLVLRKIIASQRHHLLGAVDAEHTTGGQAPTERRAHLAVTTTDIEHVLLAAQCQFVD